MLSGYWQGKQKWTLANAVRNDDTEGRNLGKTFEFVFPEFAPEQAESQRFWFGGAEWYFTTEKNTDDDYLGVYLSLAQDQPGFSVKLKSYKFVVIDQEDETYNLEKSSVPKVFSFAQGWGFHKFAKISELKRGDRSYLRTNRLVFRLEMTHATAAYDHMVDLNSLKTGSVGKFSIDSVDWMVRVIESDGNVSAFVIKTTSALGTQYAGQAKILLSNDADANLTVKRKLGIKTWTAQKTQFGETLLKVSDLKGQRGYVRNLNPVPPSPGAAAAASSSSSSVPVVPQFMVRFEMKHMTSILDVPIPSLSAALAGSSLAFAFQSYSWNLTCKKEANQLALHLHLQNPTEHKTYHTSFAMTIVSSKADDAANNLTRNFGVATFYKYTTQLGFNHFATVEDVTKARAVNNSTMLVRVHLQKMDIATTYLDATVAKGGAAAVKLAKDEIEKFRKYYYTTRAELKLAKEQLEKASVTANTLQSKQGKFQLELEPLQMALQAKTEAAETLLSDLESERNRANGLKRDLDKGRESLGFMSMLWLENVRHVANESVMPTTTTAAITRQSLSSPSSSSSLLLAGDAANALNASVSSLPNGDHHHHHYSSEHTAMATLDILNTLRHIVEESGTISSKELRKEYKKKSGTSLRETLRREHLGTPLAFLEANMGIFSFEEPVITLKPKKQVNLNISVADVTAMAVKAVPTPESISFLTDAYDFVTKFLPQVLPLPITQVFLSGAAGKSVSLSGSTTVDVVAFIDKVPDHGHGAWLPPILTQLQRVIKVKLPNATELRVSDHCVHFSFEGATINLYPTSQWQASGENVYETILKFPNGWYDAATAPQQVEFVKGQSEAVKSIIRIVQTWNHASPTTPVPDYLVELLAIYACTPKTAGAAFEPLSALSRFFEVVSDFDNQRIFWERFYKINIVPSSTFTEQPLVLDPTNPINNLARGVDGQSFKARAKEVLESGLSSLLPLFQH
jgi:hypothetical protein